MYWLIFCRQLVSQTLLSSFCSHQRRNQNLPPLPQCHVPLLQTYNVRSAVIDHAGPKLNVVSNNFSYVLMDEVAPVLSLPSTSAESLRGESVEVLLHGVEEQGLKERVKEAFEEEDVT